MAKRKISKIIWPIDVFDENRAPVRVISQVLRALTRERPAEIHPVYVMSSGQLRLYPEYWSNWEAQFRPVVLEKIAELLKNIDLPGLTEPTIITAQSKITHEAVKALTSYANEQSADLIAVTTHARKGFSRLFVGSFAETLFFHSHLPVLSVNPEVKPSEKFNRIFIPTDLSNEARIEFETVAHFAAVLKTKVTIYHSFPTVFLPEAMVLPASYATYTQEDLEKQKSVLEGWAQWARTLGIEVDVILDTKAGTSAEAILDQTKDDPAQKERELHPERNPVLRVLRRLIRITPDYVEDHFFVRVNAKTYATPLFVALVVVETTDVIFAVDSIPAILAITSDPFIVYTSNVFAILGLRALYFAVAGTSEIFQYIKYGLSAILVFVGFKMVISDFYKVPIILSLTVIGGVLTISLLASVLKSKQGR